MTTLRTDLLKIASELPAGDPTRRAILATVKGMSKGASKSVTDLLLDETGHAVGRVQDDMLRRAQGVARRLGHTVVGYNLWIDSKGIYADVTVETDTAEVFGETDAEEYADALGLRPVEGKPTDHDEIRMSWRFPLPEISN